jgi:hypothetical protein
MRLATLGLLQAPGCAVLLDPYLLFDLFRAGNRCGLEFDDGELEEVDCDDDDDRYRPFPW